MEHTAFAQEVSTLLNIPLSEVSSIEDEETLYTVAYLHYEKGSYADAAQFFTKLVTCNPFVEKYWKGLASSKQMQGEYRAALDAWSSCALLEIRDPCVHFHAAECLLSLHDKEEALKALETAESFLTRSESDTLLRNKIAALKQVNKPS